jgi:hypothetical protein
VRRRSWKCSPGTPAAAVAFFGEIENGMESIVGRIATAFCPPRQVRGGTSAAVDDPAKTGFLCWPEEATGRNRRR